MTLIFSASSFRCYLSLLKEHQFAGIVSIAGNCSCNCWPCFSVNVAINFCDLLLTEVWFLAVCLMLQMDLHIDVKCKLKCTLV